MSSSTHQILCGACRRPVKTIANAKPNHEVTCTGCGRKDRLDKVVATAKEHAVYLAQKALAEHLTKSTRNNSFIKLTAKQVPYRSFRWMIEGKVL